MKSVISSSSPVARRRGAAPRGQLGERAAGRAVGLGRQLARALDPELAHVGPLPVALVAALWLSECVVGAGHVEYVVDDLEQHTQLGREAAEGSGLRGVGGPRQQ